MGRVLNGRELQGFIMERQLRQVRNLCQQHAITPTLAIVMSDQADAVIHTYVRMKQRYAADIGVEVVVHAVPQSAMADTIRAANDDHSIQGIILQLPIDDPSQTDQLCSMIAADKDVDGLGAGSLYPSATAQAIDWLLAGYNVELTGKHIAIVGDGKLVGNPLARMWKQQGLAVTVLDKSSDNTVQVVRASDVIVTATGVPRLISPDDLAHAAVVVDAGTASEHGSIVGDLDPSVYDRTDLTITPTIGGVGPLTISVLFDHVIESCLRRAGKL